MNNHIFLSDPGDHAFNVITSQDFVSMFDNSKPWLVQVR